MELLLSLKLYKIKSEYAQRHASSHERWNAPESFRKTVVVKAVGLFNRVGISVHRWGGVAKYSQVTPPRIDHHSPTAPPDMGRRRPLLLRFRLVVF